VGSGFHFGRVAITPQRKCAECEEQEKLLQKTPAPAGSNGYADDHAVLSGLNQSPGVPISTSARAFLEPRFGHDFSEVRVHTDSAAAQSARAVNALAYTVGRDIVFAAGQYRPATAQGLRLLGHELVHTLQQNMGKSAGAQALQRQGLDPGSGSGDKGSKDKKPGDSGSKHKGNCSGWEQDVESFSKVIAEFYVRNELGVEGHATSIKCPNSPTVCYWTVDTKDGNIVVRVSLRSIPNFVEAARSNAGPTCIYDYDCSADGSTVSLTRRSCLKEWLPPPDVP
jgi:hypothetical protein